MFTYNAYTIPYTIHCRYTKVYASVDDPLMGAMGAIDMEPGGFML